VFICLQGDAPEAAKPHEGPASGQKTPPPEHSPEAGLSGRVGLTTCGMGLITCGLRAESASVVVRNCPGRSAAEFLCVAAAYVREVKFRLDFSALPRAGWLVDCS